MKKRYRNFGMRISVIVCMTIITSAALCSVHFKAIVAHALVSGNIFQAL